MRHVPPLHVPPSHVPSSKTGASWPASMTRGCCLAIAIVLFATCRMFIAEPAWAIDRERLYREAVHILGGHANVINRWRGTIRFSYAGDRRYRQQARTIVNEAAALAAIRVADLSGNGPSALDFIDLLKSRRPDAAGPFCGTDVTAGCVNFVVVLTDASTMRALAAAIPLRSLYVRALRRHPQLPCFFAPFIRARGEIYRAVIYVRHDLSADMRRTCLAEEIYQSLGLFNDYTGARYFSFNNTVAPKSITRFDRLLLRALYDPRIPFGAPVNRVVLRFLDDLGK